MQKSIKLILNNYENSCMDMNRPKEKENDEDSIKAYKSLLKDSILVEKPLRDAGTNKRFSFPNHLYRSFETVFCADLVDSDRINHELSNFSIKFNSNENNWNSKQTNSRINDKHSSLINPKELEIKGELKNKTCSKNENKSNQNNSKADFFTFSDQSKLKVKNFDDELFNEKAEFGEKLEICSNKKDSRTTVMIRNIPNKLTVAQLKEIVDRFVFGKYNFMYLRIDFVNQCNVGYAFINFEDPEAVSEFYRLFDSYTWDRKIFKSNKIVKLAYATIQGLPALKEKFKESFVMKTEPDFRPKLFYTDGRKKGQERKFS